MGPNRNKLLSAGLVAALIPAVLPAADRAGLEARSIERLAGIRAAYLEHLTNTGQPAPDARADKVAQVTPPGPRPVGWPNK